MSPTKRINQWSRGIAVAAFAALSGSAPALAGTYVYVSNADDGDISTYVMQANGALQAGARVKAAALVMPMAVSPDRRFLYAASRSKPYTIHAYAIDFTTGRLTPLATVSAADSFPFISLDRTGRYLFGASYGSNFVSVNAVGGDGRVEPAPLQTIPIGRNAHCIRVDGSNRFAFASSLGSDQVFQFAFDQKTGRLASNTPAVIQAKALTGPRHFVVSGDNRYVYLLSELVGTVTSFKLDGVTGLLSESSSASALPPASTLAPGLPRGAVGGPTAPAPHNTDNDIWAADLHLTPDGRFLYVSERTGNALSLLAVDGTTGTLRYVSSTPTERQPRGFAIDSKGRFLVASGEKSDRLSVYSIDPATGALALVGRYPAGHGANWVEIVDIE